MDQNDQIRNLSISSRIEEAEKLFQSGDYEQSHHARFLILAELAEERIFHLLKKYSEIWSEQFPHFFSYSLFNLLALKELELLDDFILKGEKVFENLLLNKKKYDDIKKNDLSIVETLSELAPSNEALIYSHVWLTWCDLARSYELNQPLNKKQIKHLAELLIWKPNSFHFRLAITMLGLSQMHEACRFAFKMGQSKKLVSYPELVKYQNFLKAILLTQENTDLLQNTKKQSTFPGSGSRETSRKRSDLGLYHPPIVENYDELIRNLDYENPSVELYPELMTSFLAIQAYEVVHHLLRKVSTQNLSFELSKRIKSIECLYYMEREEYYLVLSLVEELRGMNATADELLELDYMEGTIYLKLKQRNRAYEFFKRVSYKNPNYRLVKERLKSVEKN